MSEPETIAWPLRRRRESVTVVELVAYMHRVLDAQSDPSNRASVQAGIDMMAGMLPHFIAHTPPAEVKFEDI